MRYRTAFCQFPISWSFSTTPLLPRMSHAYPVPAARHRAEAVLTRSRFVCTLTRTSIAADAQAFIREINTEFANATHNCWAYVAGPPGDMNQVGMSDDGEPHGTAGRPMLTVLLHSGVGEIAAVVTRYYGVTKLGTGGLVKAYSGAVQLALATLPLATRVDYTRLRITIPYPSVTVAQQLLSAHAAEVLEDTWAVDVTFVVQVPRESRDALVDALRDATRGDARIDSPD